MGVAVALLGATALSAQARDRGGDPAVVVEWNEEVAAVQATGLSPPRYYAMVHVAMFDAINSITRTHQPYLARHWAPAGASAEVAAAQAARDVLVAQAPALQARFDALLAARIATVAPGRAQSGIQVGKAAAAAVLDWRQDDGWSATFELYAVEPTLPGGYSPLTPAAPANPSAQFRQMQYMVPFALVTPTQYLPAAPPLLTSAQYATDYEETRTYGQNTSALRTAEQTQLARLLAGTGTRTAHWALWNQVARDLSRERGLSLVETARLFALVNVSIQDGLQTSHASKFVYGFWRPITAIRRGSDDLNDATVGDPTWTPLLTTPPYPSHGGNMACVSASAARAMERYWETDGATFTVRWFDTAGDLIVARSYTTFAQLALDQANSRIWGGIHFRFESEASRAACPRVADWVYAHYMRPMYGGYGRR
jgi:hypothetical protein